MKPTERIEAFPPTGRLSRWACFAGAVLFVPLAVAPAVAQDAAPRFVQELPAEGRGEFIKCDLQHRFTDTDLNVTQFVARAVDAGCRVVIVTPSRPIDQPAALTRFLREVEAAQRGFPDAIVLPGYSWHIRARGASGRATILLPPSADFIERFLGLPKRLVRRGSETTTAESLAKSLRQLCPEDVPGDQWPVILFDQFRDGTRLHQWSVERFVPGELWSPQRPAGQSVLGQSGLLDRWDQSDIRSGGEWDQLLAEGWNAWAAADNLDFVLQTLTHKRPGEFTETWLRLPEVSAEHAVRALRCGAFFGVRGGATRDVELSVVVEGLSRPALAGETIDVPAGTPIRVQLALTIPDSDWKKSRNRLDGIELIGVTPEGSSILHKVTPTTGRVKIEYATDVPEGGILFRALGYRVVKDGADHSFYTNPIRIVTEGRWARPEAKVIRKPWLQETTGIWLAGLMLALSTFAVGVWLLVTGKMALVIGDSFDPIVRIWYSSKLRRRLVRTFPDLFRSSSAETDTLGTSLTEQECRGLVAALIAGCVLVGAAAGATWRPPEELSLSWPIGRIPGWLIGGVAGGLLGAIGRYRPFIGLWTWVLVRMVSLILPAMGCEHFMPGLLAAALLGLIAYEPLRTGTVRWPAAFPFGGLAGLLGLVVVASVTAAAAPGIGGDLALLVSYLTAAGWIAFNSEPGHYALRRLALVFVMLLWFGAALAQFHVHAEPLSSTFGLHVFVEAVGLAAAWSASSPRRLDAISIVLIVPVLELVRQPFGPASASAESTFLTAAALIAGLMLATAESAALWRIGGIAAALGMGRVLLFAAEGSGQWLAGGLACLACSLAHPSALRLFLFLAPYVLAGGYLSLIHSSEAPGDGLAAMTLVDFLQQEVKSLQSASDGASGPLATLGQFLSCFSLAGLTAFAWLTRHRDPSAADLFDSFGRLSLAALVFSGGCVLLSLPFPSSAVLALAPLIGLWAAQLRVQAENPAAAADPFVIEERFWRRWRFRLGAAAAVVAGLLAYGSLVPFQWRDVAWTQAVQEFLEQARTQTLWTRLSSDRLVNVSLTIPLAFCAYGSLVLGRRDVLSRIWGIAEALQLSIVVSILVEIAQSWSVGRMASVDDVVAQALGAGLGIVGWVVVGERVVTRWAGSSKLQSNEGRWEQVLAAYLLGVLILAVLPAGMPVTSPKQVYDRFRDGQLALAPFADCGTWGDVARDAVVGILLFIPAGMWGAIAFRKPGDPLRPLWSATISGLSIAALITVVRSLLSVRMTDSSWLLTGLIGSAIGAAAVHLSARTRFNRYANWQSGLGWWSLCILLAAAIAGNLLHPWTFDAPADAVAAGWKAFLKTPFAGFHTGNDWLLIEEVLRKLAWFGALGMVLGQAVCRSAELPAGRIAGAVAAALLAVSLAAGIEIGQLHQTAHSADITDVLIYVVGAVLGFWIRFAWLNDAMTDGLPEPATGPSATRSAAATSWVSVLQTAVAVGFILGLLLGLTLLFLRK